MMSHQVEPTAAPDKQAMRRVLRAQRRSLASQRDRSSDGERIAAAAGSLLDTLALPSSHPGEVSHPGHAGDVSQGAQAGEDPHTGEDPAYDGPACVAIYRSLPLEPPTEALATMLTARGATVIVPETLPDFDLQWHELRADGSEGPRLGLGGIGAAHLILTPALSVDSTGTRLGQGGGCYDRALQRRRPDAVIVAIINDQEYVDGPLPDDPHDVRVGGVITPGGGFRPIPDSPVS